MPAAAMPALHHVGLNSVDPERAIAWYLRVWPTATRTVVAGVPAIAADMFVMFHKVDRPPPARGGTTSTARSRRARSGTSARSRTRPTSRRG
jgi:hypothetical protein